MTDQPLIKMKFLWWLRSLLYLWVKTKIVPGQRILEELGIDPQKPICYLMYSRSISDLLVLDETCKKLKLPLPRSKPTALKFPGSASFIYLHKIGLLQMSRGSGKNPPTPLFSMVKQAEKDTEMEVQLVPVSIFWGRNPGKNDKERSLFEILFSDNERAGLLKKLIIVLVHGRGSVINFGKPISLRTQVDEGKSAEETAKKLRRVLRVHYIRQRTAALGPSLPDRSRVVNSLMITKVIKDAILEDSRKRKCSEIKSREKAHSYLMEIAADTNHRVVKFFDKFLEWVWNKIFEGVEIKNSQRLRDLSKTHELVLLPSHRSHMDYLLLAWSTYNQGMAVPHTAAGVNLNFWPVGAVIRKAGAFYIRRSFGGNKLYAACFNEYVHHILTKGHTLKFYIEGGRSRTGRLLAPKTGMLSMVVQSYYRSSSKPIAIMPVYIGYDKVMEVTTYLNELRGKKKKSESIGQFLKLRRIFKMKFGKAYIGFGKPIMLTEFLDSRRKNWKEESQDSAKLPEWHGEVVSELAKETLIGINSAAIVNPVSLLALVLLATPAKAMAEEELIAMMEIFMENMKTLPYSDDMVVEEGSAKEFLETALTLCNAARFAHQGGDVIHLDEGEATIMTYYRNNIAHLIAIPSLVSSFLQYNDEISEAELVQSASLLYPFIQSEFFLRWPASLCTSTIEKSVATLVEQKLLVRNGENIARPGVADRLFPATKILGRIIGSTLERYAISTVLLSKYVGLGYIVRTDFESQCQLMAQRISILNGSKDLDVFDKRVFRTYIDILKDIDYVEQDEKFRLQVNPSIKLVADAAMSLLSVDIRQSISRIEIEKSS
jgi:glycerol-3-phosphate O-acyltransferase